MVVPYAGCISVSVRVQVPNNWVVWVLVIVIFGTGFGQVYDYQVLGPLGFGNKLGMPSSESLQRSSGIWGF